MSLPFFRNLVRVAVLSVAALGSAAFAQAGLGSDGYQFLEAVRDRDGAKVNAVVKDPSATTILNTRDKTSGETAMHIVAARRDTTWIRFLAKNGADPDLADRDGVTPLMIAARLGHVEGVTALLEYGARVDPLSSTGETPLIAAVHRRDIPLVRVLLANGADPDRTDNSGRSARDYVALIGERRLSEEFATADQARENAAPQQQYGPSL